MNGGPRYARIHRFGRAAELLQGGTGSLVDVALSAGYYDQPHMNAEFRELSGLTPSKFLARRHSVGNGTTVAEPEADPFFQDGGGRVT